MKTIDLTNAMERRILSAERVLPADFEGFKHEAVSLANESRFVESYWNQPLTSYAVGWRDPSPIEDTLNFVSPRVPVNRRFTYREFNHKQEWLSDANDEDVRAIGADFKEVDSYTKSEIEAKTDNKGLSICVDLDEVADTAGWEERYTSKLLRRLLRIELRRAVALLSAAATNTAKTWDTTAGKDPDMDMITDLSTGTTARGIKSNRILFGETAWVKRLLSLRAQDLAGQGSSSRMTVDELAGLLGVERILQSGERYTSSSTALSEIVGGLVIFFHAMDGVDVEDPANIKRFVSNTDTGGERKVFTQQISAKRYRITVEHYSLIKIVSSLGLRKFTVS